MIRFYRKHQKETVPTPSLYGAYIRPEPFLALRGLFLIKIVQSYQASTGLVSLIFW
jgi:hypothetical protein